MKYVTVPELRALKAAGAVTDAVIRWNGAVVEFDVKLPDGRAQLVATRKKDGQPVVRQFHDPGLLVPVQN